MAENNKLPILTVKALEDSKELTVKQIESICQDSGLSTKQWGLMLHPTPEKHKKQRKGAKGKVLTYVTGGYITKVLNLAFGPLNWDFEIVKWEILIPAKQCIVQGKLTIRVGDRVTVKHQFGRASVKFFQGTEIPVDIGNDLKAAATDCEKKCASKLGIASDVYNAEDYVPVTVVDEESRDLKSQERDEEIKRLDDHFSTINVMADLQNEWQIYVSGAGASNIKEEHRQVFAKHAKRLIENKL